jgi:tetrahydromethanopterin S-methyltransferase subunit A
MVEFNLFIRYMIVGGPESEGHLTGEALKALIRNGVDEKMRILDTSAPHPFFLLFMEETPCKSVLLVLEMSAAN